MKLSIICPKCSFRISSDLEYSLNKGVCPKCGITIESLTGENKGDIGAVNMFITSCLELNLPLSPQQILDLINKYFKEKLKFSLPDLEIDEPVAQKISQIEHALTEVAETTLESKGTSKKKKLKKIPKVKAMFTSSTPGIPITQQEAEDTLSDLKEGSLVTPPSPRDYSEDGISFNIYSEDSKEGRKSTLDSIKQKIKQAEEEI